MGIYVEMAIVSAVTVYIVDLSGFTESWRGCIARWMHIRPENLRQLHPFDCGQCMSWWVCLVWALCCGELTLGTVGWSALLAFLSVVTGQFLIMLREVMIFLINRIMNRL